jgi:fibronectin-binding autotransporter adhesin
MSLHGFRSSGFFSGFQSSNASGGNEIQNIGIYRYHLFTSGGTFSVLNGGNFEVIVIGAGGGGGRNVGGGGGGGAKEPLSGYGSQILPVGNYSVTVASGGSGGTTGRGGVPSSTSFVGVSTISALGGGGGSGTGDDNGINGGSGGGARFAGIAGLAFGSNTNNGGTAVPFPVGDPHYGAAGGGGATSVGSNGTTTIGGNGGQGILLTSLDTNLTSANFTSFSGMTRVCSGGGGGTFNGGTPGSGGTGGGNGTNTQATTGGNATSFGSGGGGGGNSPNLEGANGGNGFGGLIIVRYIR